MKKKILLCLVLSLSLFGCTSAKVDYENSESFEAALNEGTNVVGKIVTFDVQNYHPYSAHGVNTFSGEHLNFISENEIEVKKGDIIKAKISEQPLKANVESWIIKYELLDHQAIGVGDVLSEEKPIFNKIKDTKLTYDVYEMVIPDYFSINKGDGEVRIYNGTTEGNKNILQIIVMEYEDTTFEFLDYFLSDYEYNKVLIDTTIGDYFIEKQEVINSFYTLDITPGDSMIQELNAIVSSRAIDDAHIMTMFLMQVENNKVIVDDYYKMLNSFSANEEFVKAKEERLAEEARIQAEKEAEEARLKAEEEEQRQKEEAERLAARTKTFTAGKYKVGVDIEPGKYNMIAIAGRGNCYVTDRSGYYEVLETFKKGGDKYAIASYNNVTLEYGYTIEVTSTLKIKFKPVD